MPVQSTSTHGGSNTLARGEGWLGGQGTQLGTVGLVGTMWD
jgi:hypothetical protein